MNLQDAIMESAIFVHIQTLPADTRSRNIDITLEEIKKTIREMGIGLFRFAGSTTPVSLSRRIADALLQEGLIVEYSMFIRAENKAKDRMAELIESYEEINTFRA